MRAAMLAVGLGACFSTGTGDAAGTTTASDSARDTGESCPEAPAIASIAYGCDPETYAWWYDVETHGRTWGASLDVSEYESAWYYHEIHPIRAGEWSEDTCSEALHLDLEFVLDYEEVEEGATTSFGCSPNVLEMLALLLDVYSTEAADEMGDCAEVSPVPISATPPCAWWTCSATDTYEYACTPG